MKNFDKNIMRDDDRINETGEVFTPTALVQTILQSVPVDAEQTYLDPTVGNGQFLAELLRQLVSQGIPAKTIIEQQLHGADLMLDNVKLCIYRLCVDSNASTIPGYESDFSKAPESVVNPQGFKHNICCADGLEYDYSFTRFNPAVHAPETQSADGNFYLGYTTPEPADNTALFEW